MEKQKLLEEELLKLKELNNQLNLVTFQLGEIEVKIDDLNKEKLLVLSRLPEIRQEQQNTGTELIQKYGNGTIDLESGDFIKKA